MTKKKKSSPTNQRVFGLKKKTKQMVLPQNGNTQCGPPPLATPLGSNQNFKSNSSICSFPDIGKIWLRLETDMKNCPTWSNSRYSNLPGSLRFSTWAFFEHHGHTVNSEATRFFFVSVDFFTHFNYGICIADYRTVAIASMSLILTTFRQN